MRETIGAVVRKPVFRIKLIAISLLFVVSLIEQVSNNYIQSSGQQVGRMTVILLLMHTFSYFSFYLSVFFVGYILLIPDIVKDAFIERQTMMRCQSTERGHTPKGNRKNYSLFDSLCYLVCNAYHPCWGDLVP